jgi:hypothetical protein
MEYLLYKSCENKGGKLIKTGDYSITWIYNGGVSTPLVSEEEKCSK